MAVRESTERYSRATIDCSDMTLTEYRADDVRTYSIMDILRRWDKIADIELEIRRRAPLPGMRGEDAGESQI